MQCTVKLACDSVLCDDDDDDDEKNRSTISKHDTRAIPTTPPSKSLASRHDKQLPGRKRDILASVKKL